MRYPPSPVGAPPVATTTVASPVGLLTLTWAEGALTSLHMQGQAHAPSAPSFPSHDTRPFSEVLNQLEAYFAGTLTRFDVPLRLAGSEFQRAVWTALLDIPYGQTRSYAQIAAAVGKPGAARAVGLANGRNPVAIIVPCHRVIAADGTLGGYGGGLDRKRLLLALEQSPAAKSHVGPRHHGPGPAM